MGKKVLSVTIDEEVLDSWKKFTEEECINSSQLIEKMMKEYLKTKGGK
jgi:metal-responsive CopG/Arc/MetJ family transcriptional regulator